MYTTPLPPHRHLALGVVPLPDAPRLLACTIEPERLALLLDELLALGVDVERTPHPARVASRVADGRVDLVVLDAWRMTAQVGQLLGELRRVATPPPVLVVSGRDDASERTMLLRAGADRCVSLPVGRQEWLARVGALLTRARAWAPADAHGVLRRDDVLLALGQGAAYRGGERLAMPDHAFELLVELLRVPGEVVPYGRMARSWACDDVLAEWRCRRYVQRLRAVLGTAHASGRWHVYNLRGLGYKALFEPARERRRVAGA